MTTAHAGAGRSSAACADQFLSRCTSSGSGIVRKAIPNDIGAYVSYEPETGHFLRIASKFKRYLGPILPFIHPDGYVSVYANGSKYAAHRLAWFLTYGEQPDYIDHRNGDRADNRLENLRSATSNQNAFNRQGSGALPKGVTFHRARGKYQAQMRAYGQSKYLGLFHTAEEASDAYQKAVAAIHREFARVE